MSPNTLPKLNDIVQPHFIYLLEMMIPKAKLKIAIQIIRMYEGDSEYNKFGISNKITDLEDWINFQLNTDENGDFISVK